MEVIKGKRYSAGFRGGLGGGQKKGKTWGKDWEGYVVEVGDEGRGVGWEIGQGAGGNCWEKWGLEECRGED